MPETPNAPGGREPGFQIRGRFYKAVSLDEYLLDDPVLIRETTRIEFPDFVERLWKLETGPDSALLDPVLLKGVIAVAIWHANPDWRLDQVTQYVGKLRITEAELVGFDEEQGPEDASPVPLDKPIETDSPPPSPTSSETPDTASEPLPHNGSGTPESLAGVTV